MLNEIKLTIFVKKNSMNNITKLIFKAIVAFLIWGIYMSLMAEYILNTEVNGIIQIASILIALLLTMGVIRYMVKSFNNFINKEKND